MLSQSDSECLAGLVREYIANPLETFRRGIIRDFLEDKGDYRYHRVSHFDHVHEKIMKYGPEMLELSNEVDEVDRDIIRTIDNHPMSRVTKPPLRRAYLFSLFRYMPIFRVAPHTDRQETERNVEVLNTMETAWDWMLAVGTKPTWIYHQYVVAGEMMFCHLIERRGAVRELTLPGIGPELRYEASDQLLAQNRPHAYHLNCRRWDTLRDLAKACIMSNYQERTRHISLDRTLSSSHDMVARNFNYNLWSRIYSVFPIPRTR